MVTFVIRSACVIFAILILVPSASAEPPGLTPSRPREFEAKLLSGSPGVQLSWIPPEHPGAAAITGFNVYKDGALTAQVTGTTFQDPVVDLDAVYVVVAENSYGEGEQSYPSSPTFAGGCIVLSGQEVPPAVGVQLGCTFIFFERACAIPNDPPHTQVCLVRDEYEELIQDISDLFP